MTTLEQVTLWVNGEAKVVADGMYGPLLNVNYSHSKFPLTIDAAAQALVVRGKTFVRDGDTIILDGVRISQTGVPGNGLLVQYDYE